MGKETVRVKRVGVLFNPAAGRADCFNMIGKALSDKFASCDEFVTGPGDFGAKFILGARVLSLHNARSHGVGLEELVDVFCNFGLDLLIGVGGDGTLNRLASRLLQRNQLVPLMGIAAGTANVGPLIQFNRRALELFDLSKVEVFEVRPITVWIQNRHCGYAFVDAIIGETFLGTVNRSMECLDASAFYYNKEKKKRPANIGVMKGVRISKGRRSYVLPDISQIIAAPINSARFYIGKAVTGALCWAWHLGKEAVVSFTSTNIVDPYVDLDHLAEREPIVVGHILFGRQEIVEIKGVPEDKFLILDGNPVCPAGGQVIRIGVMSRGVLVVSNQLCGENCGPVPFDWDA